ncbi:ABC transporter ATP-binding protein [Streptomyces beihaiensis]|uniref:ABC transporter ATP-binding protein/permease n=1 Tax=Streptomyces beihaiensis TaxID=2984495 RepID=A0ABT3TNM9_9ACTN|nr:ABC transporter ATP-binding protein [Streptomyces beihaiensis]MCX3058658.1 ABC transporter ATP-binding protein/permease [Streptomyces beihaiensis]
MAGPAAARMAAGGGPGSRSMDFKGSGKRLLKRLAAHRAAVACVLVSVMVSVGLSVVGPKILGRATDLLFGGIIGGRMPAGQTKQQVIDGLRARGQGGVADMLGGVDFTPGKGVDFGHIGEVLLLGLAVFACAGLAMMIGTRLANRLINLAVARLRADMQAKLERLPLSYYDRQKRGEVLSRATNDIDNINQTMQQSMGQMLNSLLTVIGVLTMMFWISWILALVALVTVPLSVFVAAKVGKRAQPQFVQQWRTTGALNAHVEEMYTGHALVKVFGRQKESAEQFAEQNQALYEASFKAQFNSGIMQPLMFFISNLNYVLVAVVGGLRVASGSLSIGDVQAFIQYSRQFSMPLTQLASMANLVQSGVASAERIFELLDAEEQSADPAPGQKPDPLRGHVEFEHVAFRYEEDKPLIEDLSLTAEPGHTVAIVGPTGAGKTTLVNLLLRFYEVTGGRITLDGVDIAKMTRDDLRAGIGMVLQDTWLFGGTIAENIAYGSAKDVSREQVEAAAKAAHADRFIRTLPDGYDTVLDDEGTGVSAGEKQLITIARAFLSDPVILVLDEATSSVDTRTEVLIQKAMARLAAGRTSFVIAHRLSTIRDADTILVMENGAIVEQGSHDELVGSGGAYQRLYEAQFAEAVAEVD